MLCPKCHQPLDDGDEQYICCAGANLQWRCRQCAKVSEGFAFPYGACPHCGGWLEALATRSINEPTELTGIRTAFEIELGGQAFYRRAATDTADPQLRELFDRFAAMEQEHLETLARRYHVAVAPSPKSVSVDIAAIFAGIESRPADPANLFRIAIAAEQRAVEFFGRRAAKAKPGSLEEQLYRELAAEERDHAAILTTEYERWKAGKGGLLR